MMCQDNLFNGFFFGAEEQAKNPENPDEYSFKAHARASDLKRIFRMSKRLEYGLIRAKSTLINAAQAPFVGIKKCLR